MSTTSLRVDCENSNMTKNVFFFFFVLKASYLLDLNEMSRTHWKEPIHLLDHNSVANTQRD